MEWQYSAAADEAHESCISPRHARVARATHLPKPRSLQSGGSVRKEIHSAEGSRAVCRGGRSAL